MLKHFLLVYLISVLIGCTLVTLTITIGMMANMNVIIEQVLLVFFVAGMYANVGGIPAAIVLWYLRRWIYTKYGDRPAFARKAVLLTAIALHLTAVALVCFDELRHSGEGISILLLSVIIIGYGAPFLAYLWFYDAPIPLYTYIEVEEDDDQEDSTILP